MENQIRIEKATPTIGAYVHGLALDRPLSDERVSAINDALLDNMVLFFTGQKLTPELFHAFGQRLGPLDARATFESLGGELKALHHVRFEGTPVRGQVRADHWHADGTFRACPARASALLPLELPRLGGDTLWASMYAAYDALPDHIKQMLDGMEAIHKLDAKPGATHEVDPESYTGTAHPMVRVHPETGRKALFINRMFTRQVVGMSYAESQRFLDFLLVHALEPTFQVRLRWSPDLVVMWDNRCTHHYAVNDYSERRHMLRMTWGGDRPVGPDQKERQQERAAVHME